MIGETARPIGRAISTIVASAPRLVAVAAISSPMNPAPMMTTLSPGPSRSRIAVASAMSRKSEYARKIDARNIEPPLPRACREDEMAVTDRRAVAELDLPRSAVDPRCADAESQVDALLAKERFGPERQAMDVHLAFEKRLRQRRALIGQILLGGQKDDLAVEPLFAQARRSLNSRVAGADDDDRGGRHGFRSAVARHPPKSSVDVICWRRAGSRAAWLPAPPGPGRRAALLPAR